MSQLKFLNETNELTIGIQQWFIEIITPFFRLVFMSGFALKYK